MNLSKEALIVFVELFANYLRKKKKLKLFLLIISPIILVSTATFIIFYNNNIKVYQLVISIFVIIVSFLVSVSSILGFSEEDNIRFKDPFDIELKKLSKEREELKKKVSNDYSNLENNVFNTIQLNLNQTTEYYTINKSQARRSFGASVFAIVAGLVTILVGIWLMYFKENITSSIISFASSVLLEVIGGMYFHIYNKSLNQLNYFYGKLEKMQDTMIAIELTNGIKDENKKMELQEKLIINLIERSSKIK